MTQLQSEGINTSGIQFLEPPLFEVKLYHYLNKKQKLVSGYHSSS